jgi:hypothetical protein
LPERRHYMGRPFPLPRVRHAGHTLRGQMASPR